jgi:hypothetical protein
MKTFTTLTTTAAFALAAAGCGDSASSSSPSSEEHQQATPAEAAAKARETSAALDKALATYRKGDAKAAEQQVGDAYLASFEDVERPLEARDHDLKERLEHQVATTIRAKMKAKAPVGEVAAEVRDAQRGLSQAEAKLR